MLQAICKKFDWESNVPIGTHGHSTKTDAQDVAKVTAVVMDKKLLDVEKGRAHKAFPDFKLNPLWKWDQDKEWIKMKVKEFEKGAFTEDGNGQDDLEDIESNVYRISLMYICVDINY